MARRAAPLSQEGNLHDPAREVEISYELRYTECDLADERFENHPVLQLFFSSHLIRSQAGGGVANIPLDESHLSNVYAGKLRGSLLRKYDGIPAMAAIGIDSYAIHYDQNGTQCFVNVGTSHAYLGAVLDEVRKKGAYDHTHDLLMRTTVVGVGQQLKKGSIELRVTGVKMGPSLTARVIASPLQAPIASIESELSAYIERCMQVETALPDLLEGTERIRAPMDISQVGIESTGNSFLPIAAFAMIEVPETNADFFRNAIQNVMRRHNMERAHFSALPEHEKCRFLGLLVAYGVQTFNYIGDSVELCPRGRGGGFTERLIQAHAKWTSSRVGKEFPPAHHSEGTEEFSNIWTTTAGDCEDSAMGIYTTLKAFQQTSFDARTDPDLAELQQISTDYQPFLTLAVVHGQKIGDHEGVGAHMYLPLLPRHQVHEALGRTAAGRDLLERMNPGARGVDYRPFVGARASSHQELVARRPPLFCEGTGVIDPLGYTDPIFEKRKYVAMQMPAFGAFKKEIPHAERAESSFYLANMLGVNADAIRQGIPVGAYVYCTAQGSALKRGVLFTDMLKDSSSVALLPQPFIPESTLRIMEEANTLSPPPRPLVLDLAQPMDGEERHPLLEAFVQHVRSLGRSGRGDSVDAFILPTQLTKNAVGAMMTDASNATRLVGAQYVREMITNSLYLYRLQLFIE